MHSMGGGGGGGQCWGSFNTLAPKLPGLPLHFHLHSSKSMGSCMLVSYVCYFQGLPGSFLNCRDGLIDLMH